MATVTQMKCACKTCLWVVNLNDAVQKVANTLAKRLVIMVIQQVKGDVDILDVVATAKLKLDQRQDRADSPIETARSRYR